MSLTMLLAVVAIACFFSMLAALNAAMDLSERVEELERQLEFTSPVPLLPERRRK
jgi:hypothetical protein